MKYIYITGVLLLGLISKMNAQESKADILSKIMFETKISQLQEDIVSMVAAGDEEVSKTIQTKMLKPTKELYKNLAGQLSNTFTESEVKNLIVFYKSPEGKKLLETSVEFSNSTTTLLQDWQIGIEELLMDSN